MSQKILRLLLVNILLLGLFTVAFAQDTTPEPPSQGLIDAESTDNNSYTVTSPQGIVARFGPSTRDRIVTTLEPNQIVQGNQKCVHQ